MLGFAGRHEFEEVLGWQAIESNGSETALQDAKEALDPLISRAALMLEVGTVKTTLWVLHVNSFTTSSLNLYA